MLLLFIFLSSLQHKAIKNNPIKDNENPYTENPDPNQKLELPLLLVRILLQREREREGEREDLRRGNPSHRRTGLTATSLDVMTTESATSLLQFSQFLLWRLFSFFLCLSRLT